MKRTLVAIAALALTAGCGAQQGSTGVASVTTASAKATTAASPTGSVDPQEQGRKFAQCMRDHGVDMPDPDPDGGGGLKMLSGKAADKQKISKALESCRTTTGFKDAVQPKADQVDTLRQLAQCMRANGVDMPDPNPDGTFPSGTAGRVFGATDPKTKKAYQTCGKQVPKLVGRTGK